MEWLFTILCSNDGTNIELTDEPQDWETYEIKLFRHDLYHGKVSQMTNSLTFYGEGYQFIKDKYDLFGAQVELVMEVLVACQGEWQSLPGARIDIGTMQFHEGDECSVTANLEDASCIMKFMNRRDLQVDAFSTDPVDLGEVNPLQEYDWMGSLTTMPSIPILKQIDTEVEIDMQGDYSETQTVGAGVGLSLNYVEGWWHVGYDKINLDEIGETFYGLVRYVDDASFPPALVTVSESGSYAIDVSIDISVLVGVNSPIPLFGLGCSGPPYGLNELDVSVYLSIGGTLVALDTFVGIGPGGCFPASTSCNPPDSTSYSNILTHSGTYSLLAGDKIKLYVYVKYGAGYDNGTLINQDIDFCERVILNAGADNFFRVQLNSDSDATLVKTGMVNESLSRIAEKLTGGCLRVYSSYFGRPDAEPYDRPDPDAAEDTIGCGALEVLTNGLLARQVINAESMFISWNDLYNGLDNIHCLGLGVEDDPFRAFTTYTWDFNDVLALSEPSFSGATKTIEVNGTPEAITAANITEYLDFINAFSDDVFFLDGTNLVVVSAINVYGEILFSPIYTLEPTIEVTEDLAQRLRVEKRTFFYEDDAMDFQVSYPTSILRTIKLDLFHVKALFGYSTWESEEFNGLDEFNTKRAYTSRQNQIGGELNVLSSLIGSGYAMEVTRRKGKTTRDWKYDNSIFITCVSTDDHTIAEQGNITSPANILFPDDVYNFRLSPARNAIRWFEWLFAMFKDHTDEDKARFRFMAGEGNYIAEGLVTGGCVPETAVLNESQDLVYTDKSDNETELPRLGWEQWQFTYPMEFSDYLTVRDNFYKKVPVRFGNNTEYLEAYISEITYRPAQSEADFILIRAVGQIEDSDFLLQEDGFAILLEVGDHILI